MGRCLLAATLLLAAAANALAQVGRVSGTVRDERGEPIRGAIIIAENPDASPSSFTVTSDDSGRFGIIGLRSGLWMLRAGAPGFSTDGGELNVRTLPNNTPPVTFRLERLALPPSALGSISPKDIQTELARADALYNGERWDEAIAAYREILRRSPALSVINLQIAAAYRHRSAFDEAIRTYNELLKADPTNAKATIGIAMTNLERGDPVSAEQTLEVAAQAPGATGELFYELGELKQARALVDEAITAYERAAELNPTWGTPVLALGRIALDRGDAATAQRHFQTVVDVDPVSPEAAEAAILLRQLQQVR
jgi:tetratricopeptide (TPR) repeat protein